MTSEEILQANIEIANFMGWVHHEDKDYDMHEMRNLKYHTSWEDLMPVVEKIEAIDGVNIDKIKVTFDRNVCAIWNYWDVTEVLRSNKSSEDYFKIREVGKTKMEAVYKSVAAFIQWYNRQSINKPS